MKQRREEGEDRGGRNKGRWGGGRREGMDTDVGSETFETRGGGAVVAGSRVRAMYGPTIP